MAAISRRVFLSGLVLLGFPARAQTQQAALPECRATGASVGGWNWTAKPGSVTLGHDALDANDTSVILSFATLSHRHFGKPDAAVPRDRPVCVHYLVANAKPSGTAASASWDGRPATAITDEPPYTMSGGMLESAQVHMLFEQEVDPERIAQGQHREIVYELASPDGKRQALRVDARGLAPALTAGRRAMARLAADAAAKRCDDGSGCFITSATCDCLGLSDDCFELRAARRLRDEYLSRRPDGPALIAAYYREAPAIAARLASSARGRRRLIGIYWSAILPCALLVRIGAPGAAATLYAAMFRRLAADG